MLLGLPDAILVQILSVLTHRELRFCILICRRFFAIIKENEDWIFHALTLSRWGPLDLGDIGSSYGTWKDVYRLMHEDECLWESERLSLPLIWTGLWGPVFLVDAVEHRPSILSAKIPRHMRGTTVLVRNVDFRGTVAMAVERLCAQWQEALGNPSGSFEPSHFRLRACGKVCRGYFRRIHAEQPRLPRLRSGYIRKRPLECISGGRASTGSPRLQCLVTALCWRYVTRLYGAA